MRHGRYERAPQALPEERERPAQRPGRPPPLRLAAAGSDDRRSHDGARRRTRRSSASLQKATLAFEAEDTPLTRRAIAEAEWHFIAARHAYYEARARNFLAATE